MTRPAPLRDARMALALLTVIPTGARPEPGERSGSAGWFSAVGLVLGAATAAGMAVAARFITPRDALLVASIVLAFQALVTRFLHWDGLADVADAWWGGRTTDRRLEIMKDPATGAFGVTALVLAGLLQASSLAQLVSSGSLAVMLSVPVFGRLAATFAAWFGSPAREGGLGRTVMGRPGAVSGIATTVALAVAAWALVAAGGAVGAAVAALGVSAALVVPHLISMRMGGVTGDVMGASVMVVETVLYVIAAIAWRTVA